MLSEGGDGSEGDLETAEGAYGAVRDGFLRQRAGYDDALVALDLATLLAEQGRTGELKRLGEEIAPVFEAQAIHREATAAPSYSSTRSGPSG